MTPRERDFSANTLAPTLMLIAVGVVILAQLWKSIPIAGAIALAAWGSALSIPSRRRGRILLALVVYVPLVGVAIAAQLDAASGGSLGRQFFVAMDAGAAGALMVQLMRRA